MLFGSQLNRGRKHLKSAGVVVQLGERLHGMQEVVGSSPISSKAKKWLKFLCWKGFQPFIFMKKYCHIVGELNMRKRIFGGETCICEDGVVTP